MVVLWLHKKQPDLIHFLKFPAKWKLKISKICRFSRFIQFTSKSSSLPYCNYFFKITQGDRYLWSLFPGLKRATKGKCSEGKKFLWGGEARFEASRFKRHKRVLWFKWWTLLFLLNAVSAAFLNICLNWSLDLTSVWSVFVPMFAKYSFDSGSET